MKTLVVTSDKFYYLSQIFKPSSVHVDHLRNTRITGSPFLDKGRLRACLKHLLLKELGNYTTKAETS